MHKAMKKLVTFVELRENCSLSSMKLKIQTVHTQKKRVLSDLKSFRAYDGRGGPIELSGATYHN
jgi:hypothetical protein